MVMKMFRNTEKRDRRRAYLVCAYVGANGGGKTAAMVWDALPSLEAGRPVLSTVRILDYENPRQCDDEMCQENPDRFDHFMMRPTDAGREAMIRNQKRMALFGPNADLEHVEEVSTGVHRAPHPLWIPWVEWQQLLDMRFGEVLADEITGIAEARGSQTMPFAIINHLQQLRRADIPFRYTSPAWDRADLSLRQPTQTVTVCKGSWSTDAPQDGDMQRVIRARRMFKWRTYDAMELTELTEGKRTELTPEVKDRHWGPGSPAFAAYDTFAPVLTVGFVTESGRCHKCNGTRPTPKCSCAPRTYGAPEQAPDGAPARRRAAPSTDVPAVAGPAAGRRVLRVLGADAAP
ncbi:hypothetical protein [Nocardioides sp. LML1-1-1.1]|uniref:hypothetical protein n=1 Tax=Nocardioides sp. LML1-1-1.1 TaxID=3135248 RepID=UPI003445D3A5